MGEFAKKVKFAKGELKIFSFPEENGGLILLMVAVQSSENEIKEFHSKSFRRHHRYIQRSPTRVETNYRVFNSY